MSFKILSLTGGGCFGAFQAAVLEKAELAGADLSQFNAIAGTSIGSVIGTRVALFGTAKNMMEEFDERLHKIFGGYWWRHYKWPLPRYNDVPLNEVLQEYLPGQLKDSRVPLWIVSWHADQFKAKVFYSGDCCDMQWNCWEACRCSTAAPTYFSVHRDMIDGGLAANNPTMIAIAGAIRKCHAGTSRVFNVDLDDIRVFNIGTGNRKNKPIANPRRYITYGKYILGALLDGASDSVQAYEAEILLSENSFQDANFMLEKGWNIDDARVIQKIYNEKKEDIEMGAKSLVDFLSLP